MDRDGTTAASGGVPASECICYPGMCPMGCEPACPYCFQAPAPEPWEPDECRCPSGHHTCGLPNDSDDAECSPDHPHGPADPRWIDDEGRCVLCGRDYWQRRALAAEAQDEALTTGSVSVREPDEATIRATDVQSLFDLAEAFAAIRPVKCAECGDDPSPAVTANQLEWAAREIEHARAEVAVLTARLREADEALTEIRDATPGSDEGGNVGPRSASQIGRFADRLQAIARAALEAAQPRQTETGGPYHPDREGCDCAKLGVMDDGECIHADPCWVNRCAYETAMVRDRTPTPEATPDSASRGAAQPAKENQ